MPSTDAERLIESLRLGIPPEGHVRSFTVGRKAEIRALIGLLDAAAPRALLLKANYGSGKTHLLRFIEESALERNYVVSRVTLDARSNVRFNRLDQVAGAIWRELRVPCYPNEKGVRPFMNAVGHSIEAAKAEANSPDWIALTNDWLWIHSDWLESPALYVALRAWLRWNEGISLVVEDWLGHPWQYRAQRKLLYQELVLKALFQYRDPRGERQFYDDDVFAFHTSGHRQSWAALRDIHRLAVAAGYRGLILLFDEFEDVLVNISNINHKESAFWNLFQFSSQRTFPGMSFFAVTPEFQYKCMALQILRDRYEFDYDRFLHLKTFEMSPLDAKELMILAKRIVDAHAQAYDWQPAHYIDASKLDDIVRTSAASPVQDRVRHTITEVVSMLDDALEAL